MLVYHVYARFFDYNSQFKQAGILFKPTTDNQDIFNDVTYIRNHPYYGKCITYNHDKFRKYGLYYITAKWDF